MTYFHSNLKRLRNESELKQHELADIFDVDRSTIAGYENSRRQPDYDKLIAISDYFHISVDDLLKKDLNAPGNFDYEISSKEKDLKYFELCYDDLSKSSIREIFEYIKYIRTRDNSQKLRKKRD